MSEDEAPGPDLEVKIDNGKQVKINLTPKEWVIIGLFSTIIAGIISGPLALA